MDKKGQITIFIIVGILIVATIGITLVLKNTALTTQLTAQQKTSAENPLQNFVEGCLRKSTIDGLYETLGKGGYHSFPITTKVFDFTIDQQEFQLPYYFQEGTSTLPPIEEVATAVGEAATPFFVECIDHFSQFPQTITIKDTPRIQVQFTERATKVFADYPLEIMTDAKRTSMDTFAATIPFDFRKKHAAVSDFLAQQEQAPDYFAMGKLSSVAAENNFDAFFNTFNESKVVVDLVFREPLKSDPLIYSFTLGYDWGNLRSEEELQIAAAPLQLIFPPAWNIAQPGIHTFKIEAVGAGVTFETEPNDLPINPATGVITVNTRDFPNDEYLYYVQVRDNENRTVKAPIIINVNANPGNYPVLNQITVGNVSAGKELVYKVQPRNKETGPFLFTTDSTRFTINKATGEIKFTPTRNDIGPQTMRIDVENKFGRTWVRWEFEVR
ncbi:hypothetical protein HYU22_00940 [Candidatus Woesearchaeota archaeon]|nr:hypothetical protein [Candidatus Woesearchaeota archaeon]